MYAQEERAKLIEAARELTDVLRQVTTRVHAVVNHLLSAADELKIAAADEVSSGDRPAVKLVKFDAVKSDAPSVAVTAATTVLAPGKRACSICRQPGHRATTCPQAHKDFDKKRGKK